MTRRDTPAYPEVSHGRCIVVLPLGAWEQHGPHLPLDTDSVIIEKVVSTSLEHSDIDDASFFVAPVINVTASDEHLGFPGVLSTGTDALVDSVVAISRSASTWAVGVLIANGHGGNFDALQRIQSALTYENVRHSVWSLPSYAGGDMHAGHTETSLMLHIAPDSVRTHLIPQTAKEAIKVDDLRANGVKSVSPSGVLGHPATATESHGRDVFHLYTTSLVKHMLDVAERWLHSSK